jgi:ParB family transcriptional regulator, chromosome partitioning protein
MALGKSLNNILGDYFGEETDLHLTKTHTVVEEISLDQIRVTEYQMRSAFDEKSIQSLSWSIKESGLIHPVLLLKEKKGYTLISGERRFRAVQLLGHKTIPAIVKQIDSLTKDQQATLTAVENLQREDLSPLEQAKTYQVLMKTKKITDVELAEFFNFSTQHIRNYLRLLTTSPKVQQALQVRQVSEGQARLLTTLDHDLQDQILKQIIEKELTVKEIIELIYKIKNPIEKSAPVKHNLSHLIVGQAEKIAKQFGNSKVKITGDENEGRIVIAWKN